ncbi:MAG: glucan biosynthesis protein G [Candidatus Omnitrophica bacterium]|nr:glucan biosynthesis protein G [Candidatus Omnitrophota bacterium]
MRLKLLIPRVIQIVFLLLFSVVVTPSSVWAAGRKFQFQDVISQAQQLSKQSFVDVSDQNVPDFLKKIGYDQWRDIRFKPSQAFWGDNQIPFSVQFFHQGFLYKQPIIVHYMDESGVHKFIFSPNLFEYGKSDFGASVPTDLNFSGFRIHFPINKPDYQDEIAVFLGASYFRAVAKDQVYGLSARGLSVDMLADSGEEFPFFKEFWIIKPQRKSQKIIVYALLDSPRITGAYQFAIVPGQETMMQVDSVLFPRKKIEKLGIAPMTTMFFYGESPSAHGGKDFRQEVHDSDGLAIVSASGEKIWRPLTNPERLTINTFSVGMPKAFGLLQRDRNFDHYQDLEAHYQRRPSLWILPKGDWGQGHVELVQIPTGSEYNENINAFWVPEKPLEPGERSEFSYTMKWSSQEFEPVSQGYVANSWVLRQENERVRFVIDFYGPQLESIVSGHELTADISVAKDYKLLDHQVIKNDTTGGWRLVFQIEPNKDAPLKDILPNRTAVDLRAFLKYQQERVTETWDFTFLP